MVSLRVDRQARIDLVKTILSFLGFNDSLQNLWVSAVGENKSDALNVHFCTFPLDMYTKKVWLQFTLYLTHCFGDPASINTTNL